MGKKSVNLFRRYDRWYGKYKDADGVWRQRALCRDKRVAEAMLREIERNECLRSVGAPTSEATRVLLEPLVEPYLEWIRSRATDHHVVNVDYGLREVLRYLPAMRLSEVSMQSVARVQRLLVAKEQSHRTVNKKTGHLRSFLAWCERMRHIDRNPLSQVEKLPETGKHVKRRPHRLSHEEALKLVRAARLLDVEATNALPRVPQAPFIEVLLGTGFRLSEAAALRWSDLSVDEEGDWLTVRAEASKNGDPRKNPITPELAERLRVLRGMQGRVVKRLPTNEDRILVTPRGLAFRKANLDNFRRWFYKVRKKAALPESYPDGSRLHLHCLRHTYNCLLMDADVDLAVRAALMGHRNLSMTQRVYSDPQRLRKRGVVDVLPSFDVGDSASGCCDDVAQ